MISEIQVVRRAIKTAVVVLLPLLLRAQAPPSSSTGDARFPVGRWVAEHPSSGGIASWWEFRPDGTLTMYFGVMVSDQIDRSGNTFMMPSGTAGGDRVRVTYTITDNVLAIDTVAGHQTTYARLGPPLDPADPLIGNWRPLPNPAECGSDPNYAVMQKLMTTKGILTFTTDAKRYLRAPFGTKEGTWDGQSNTFRVKGDSTTYTFGQMKTKLLLGQPPDGKAMDSYVPDPLTPEPGMTEAAPMGSKGGTTSASSGPDIVRPKITHLVEASFTEEARKRKIRGTVRLEVIVEADGRIRPPHVIKSAAEAYSDPADREAARTLDQRAIDAVNQYTFSPGTLHGKPVPLAVTVEVSFQML